MNKEKDGIKKRLIRELLGHIQWKNYKVAKKIIDDIKNLEIEE